MTDYLDQLPPYAAFSADDQWLAAQIGGHVEVWNLRTKEQVARLPRFGVSHAWLAPAGDLAITIGKAGAKEASFGNEASLWDLHRNKAFPQPLRHEKRISFAAFSQLTAAP